jgi:CRP-like cAMP-binding protein
MLVNQATGVYTGTHSGATFAGDEVGMATIIDELVSLPIFRRVAQKELRASLPLWGYSVLEPGDMLWTEQQTASELAIVTSGELVASVDGVEVGRVLPAEMVGEAAAFLANHVRTATLRARKPTALLTLKVEGLRALRWQRSALYELLLDQALLALVRRIRNTDVRIAQVASGGMPAPARTEPSALVRLWKALRPGGPKGECPPLAPLLCRQPVLREVPPDLVADLCTGFTAMPVEEGQILFLEGEPGESAYIVGEGRVDVMRNVRGHKAELLATLKEGDQFGINTLVEKGPRTASCVASTAGWLYRMDASAYNGMKGDGRLVWRECVLASLASQLRNANAALQREAPAAPAPGTPAPGTAPEARPDQFQKLLQASGYLQGLTVDESELESFQVIETEDSIRNRKKR